MQYLFDKEEYEEYVSLKRASQSNENKEDVDNSPEANKLRTRYRSKELGLYQPEQFDGYIRVGINEIDPDCIISMDDDEWDELINKIDAEFNEYQEPVAVETKPDTSRDKEIKENVVVIEFTEEMPFVEQNVSVSKIRFYPKCFEKEATVNIKEFKVIDNGEIGKLQFTIYRKRKEGE